MLYILMADTVIPAFMEKEGHYGTIFENRMRAAGYRGECKYYDVFEAQEYPPIEQLTSSDAVLITGSKSDAWSDVPWVVKLTDYTKSIIGKCRVVGICFGHQIVGRALGAPVGRAADWEVSVCPMDLTPAGRSLLKNVPSDKLQLIQLHKDQVFELPQETELLAKNGVCPIQGFYRPNSLLCFQGHPEYTQYFIESISKTRFEGDRLEDVLARSGNRNDGPALNKDIVRFINGEF